MVRPSKIVLKFSKSVLVVIDYHKRSSPISGRSFKVSINGTPIFSTDKTIYLGFHLDKKLRWDDHIDANAMPPREPSSLPGATSH